MKSIMKWIAGIFLAFSLILSFFTPFELIWFNLRHGDMIVIATALSWLTVVCELWLYSQHK